LNKKYWTADHQGVQSDLWNRLESKPSSGGTMKTVSRLLPTLRLSLMIVAVLAISGTVPLLHNSNPMAVRAQAATVTTEEQIRPLETLWLESLMKADGPALERLLSPQFAYQHPSGNTYSKAEVMDAFVSKRITVTKYGPISLRFHNLGNIVISYGEHTISGVLDGGPYAGKMRFVNTWSRRSNGEWVLVHRMSELRQ
jgi:ketosteroid isomerase-like protein